MEKGKFIYPEGHSTTNGGINLKVVTNDRFRSEFIINGDEKFAKLKKDLLKAKNHIHLEYYIFESDQIGSEIIEILIQKSRQ